MKKIYYKLIGPLDRGGNRITEHLFVAQTKYGRSLKKGEVVHHINGVRLDNRPENLQIMERGAHVRLHLKGRTNPNAIRSKRNKMKKFKLKNISNGVGKRILKLRISIELTQEEFAAQIGVSQTYIAMLEKSKRQPSQALLIAMAVRFDFSENYLRTGRNGRGK